MKASKKRGFTIIELVIVIAVIAILAAVLIPTFSNVIQKAKEANDTIMVKRINEALTSDAILKGAKHANMTEALSAAFDRGYDLTKIRSTANNNEILWDSVSDCFVYMKGNEITYIPDSKDSAVSTADKWNYFRIVDTAAEVASSDYSTYLAGNDVSGDITAKAGFDAGNNTKIAKVTYENKGNKKEVVVRTNGGAVIVDAPLDTVNHYGSADSVTVKSVDYTHCYNEYGYVSTIEVNLGKVVMHKSATVNYIEVVPSESATKDNLIVDVTSKPSIYVIASTEAQEKVDVKGTTPVTEKPVLDLSFLENYSADAKRVPQGFTFNDDFHGNVTETTIREIHIASKEALLYYGYKLDKEKAKSACLNHKTDNYFCTWYQAEYNGLKTVVYLDCDIDFENQILTMPLSIYAGFDGQGHTIKNAVINTDSSTAAGLFDLASTSFVKNLTVDNIKVSTASDSAGVVGSFSPCGFENVTVKNSSASSPKYAGALATNLYGDIKNCIIENCDIISLGKEAGGLAGIYNAAGDREISGNKLTNVKVSAGEEVGGLLGRYYADGKKSQTLNLSNNVLSDVTVIATKNADNVTFDNIGVSEQNYIGKLVGRNYSSENIITIE